MVFGRKVGESLGVLSENWGSQRWGGCAGGCSSGLF